MLFFFFLKYYRISQSQLNLTAKKRKVFLKYLFTDDFHLALLKMTLEMLMRSIVTSFRENDIYYDTYNDVYISNRYFFFKCLLQT